MNKGLCMAASRVDAHIKRMDVEYIISEGNSQITHSIGAGRLSCFYHKTFF